MNIRKNLACSGVVIFALLLTGCTGQDGVTEADNAAPTSDTLSPKNTNTDGLTLTPDGFIELPKGYISQELEAASTAESTEQGTDVNSTLPAPPAGSGFEDIDTATIPEGRQQATDNSDAPTPVISDNLDPSILSDGPAPLASTEASNASNSIPKKHYVINDGSGQGLDMLVYAKSDFPGFLTLGKIDSKDTKSYIGGAKKAVSSDYGTLDPIIEDISANGMTGFATIYNSPLEGQDSTFLGMFILIKDDKVATGIISSKTKEIPAYLSTVNF